MVTFRNAFIASARAVVRTVRRLFALYMGLKVCYVCPCGRYNRQKPLKKNPTLKYLVPADYDYSKSTNDNYKSLTLDFYGTFNQ